MPFLSAGFGAFNRVDKRVRTFAVPDDLGTKSDRRQSPQRRCHLLLDREGHLILEQLAGRLALKFLQPLDQLDDLPVQRLERHSRKPMSVSRT